MLPLAAAADDGAAPSDARLDGALDEAARWLDADAGVVVRLEAATLERAAGLARTFGGEAAAGAALVTLGGVRYLGFDPLSMRGWRSAGLDPDRPALLQLAAIDARATDRVYLELSRTGGQWGAHRSSSPPLWRTRLVARATDPDRAIAALTGAALVERTAAVDPARADAVARILRAPTKRGLIRDLGRLDVVAVGAVPRFGAILFVRRRGDVVVIDLVSPFAGDALEWPRDRGALRAVLARPDGAGPPRPARQALAAPGLIAWTSPAGLHDLAQAWRASEQIRLRFGGARLPDVVKGCARLASLEHGALADLALGLEIHDRAVAVRARYRHRGPLAAALATADHGVLAGLDADHLRGEVALAGLAGLRGLARPALHDLGWDDLWSVAGWCGAGAGAQILGFGWPELAGVWLDELERAVPEVATLLDGVGNVGVAIERVARDRLALVGVVEVGLADPAIATAALALDAVFGPGGRVLEPRAHRRWGRGPLRPYLLDGRPAVVGAGFGRSTAWRLAAGPAADVADGRADADVRPPLVAARGRLDRLLPVLVHGSRWAALGKAVAARVASFQLDGRTTPGALELDLSIDLR